MRKSGKSKREGDARADKPVQKTFLEREPVSLPTALIDLNYPLLRAALPRLLEDKTTGRNIVWATDSYAHLGAEFAPGAPITIEALDKLGDEFRPRVLKRDDERRKRSVFVRPVFTERAR